MTTTAIVTALAGGVDDNAGNLQVQLADLPTEGEVSI